MQNAADTTHTVTATIKTTGSVSGAYDIVKTVYLKLLDKFEMSERRDEIISV